MRQLTCEMCGSTNVIKQEGLFICQACQTKYSLDEARKMMEESSVEIEGTVKLDESDELSNLYELARRAKDSDNTLDALKYYDMILIKDPNSWEAQFYSVYYKGMNCKIGQIAVAAYRITNSYESILNLIKNNLSKDERDEAIVEIQTKILTLSSLLFEGARNHYYGINYVKDKFVNKYVTNLKRTIDMNFVLGDLIESVFGENYLKAAVPAWMFGITIYEMFLEGNFGENEVFLDESFLNESYIISYADKIRKFDNTYKTAFEKERRVEGKRKRQGFFGKLLHKEYCPNCGLKNNKEDLYCNECGTKLQ